MTPEDRARKVIVELDGIARDVCQYEYGLPLFTNLAVKQMLDVVADQIREAVAEATGTTETAEVKNAKQPNS